VNTAELMAIREHVAAVGDAIQPLLLPHAGLARRNAYAHVWLGISTVFGDQWRATAVAHQVIDFVHWIGVNPNEDYAAFSGPAIRLPESEQTSLPRPPEKMSPHRSSGPKVVPEPSLFDAVDSQRHGSSPVGEN